jgi:hypothetical protein
MLPSAMCATLLRGLVEAIVCLGSRRQVRNAKNRRHEWRVRAHEDYQRRADWPGEWWLVRGNADGYSPRSRLISPLASSSSFRN